MPSVFACRLRALWIAALAIASSPAFGGDPLPTVGPQIRIDVTSNALSNETTVSVSEADPLCVVAGWNDYRLVSDIDAGFALSFDAGQTWSDFLLQPPPPNESFVEGDPMTAFDPRTGTLWVGAITFFAGNNSGIFVARKNPGAQQLEPVVMARTTSGVDKGWMAAGPRPDEPDSTRVYIAYNEGVIWSDDMGDTWTPPNSLGAGVGFLPRVGPNGEIYIAYWDFADGMMMKRSLDSGESFTTHTVATRMDVWDIQAGSRFPGQFRVPALLYMDVDRNTGTLYAAYFDTTNNVGGNANVDVYFTKSTDQGTTWTTPVVINGDADPPGDQFFSWIEVDKNGWIHLVYLDSRHVVQNDDVFNGMFDAYYAFSSDGGDTFTEFRLTPQSFNSADTGLNQFMGDYLGLSVAGNKAFPVYLDTSSGVANIYTNDITLPILGDLNGDGVADIQDLLQMLKEWGACLGCDGDLDGDGFVNVIDLLILLANWS